MDVKDPDTSQAGIALLVVMWALVLLTAVALALTTAVKTETAAALSHRKWVEKKYFASAGVQRGIMEILHRKATGVDRAGAEGTARMEGDVLRIDGTAWNGKIGDGFYSFRVTDESGKLDLNSLTERTRPILCSLLLGLGVREETAETIADSILDWKDADDLQRLHGAESDYYTTLNPPYRAKNADFDTLEELRMVKGMTPGILFGEGSRRGLIEFLTLHSTFKKINASAAPKELLAAVPGISPERADQIIEWRRAAGIRSVAELQAVLGEAYTVSAPLLAAGESNVFTIESEGGREGEAGLYRIRATVVIEGKNRYRFLAYKSPAN